jgi:photosystem II stability/assembly factor-like uncharacterized protein
MLLAWMLIGELSAATGWFWQNPVPQGNTLAGVAIPGPNTVCAVGLVGTILRSDDQGASWTRQSSGTRRDLSGISCVDVNTCTAVGSDTDGIQEGTILRTTNGGATWTPQSSGTIGFFEGVACVDANTCTAVGYDPALGGNAIILRASVSCIDVNICIAVGGHDTIVRTKDGGATWSVQFQGPRLEGLFAISCVDVNTCTAVGEGVDVGLIVRTTDQGATWTRQSGVNQALFGVACTDANRCIAVDGAA